MKKLIFLTVYLTLLSMLGACTDKTTINLPNDIHPWNLAVNKTGEYMLIQNQKSSDTVDLPKLSQMGTQFQSEIWFFEISSGNAHHIAKDLHNATSPRLSPSEYLAFEVAQIGYYGDPHDIELWFTSDLLNLSPVPIGRFSNTTHWTWHSKEDILMIGANQEDGSFVIQLFDPTTQATVDAQWLEGQGILSTFELSPSAKHLAATINQELHIYDLTEQVSQTLKVTSDPVYVRSWAPDGQLLLCDRYADQQYNPILVDAVIKCWVSFGVGDVLPTTRGAGWKDSTHLWMVLEWGQVEILDLNQEVGETIISDNGLICP